MTNEEDKIKEESASAEASEDKEKNQDQPAADQPEVSEEVKADVDSSDDKVKEEPKAVEAEVKKEETSKEEVTTSDDSKKAKEEVAEEDPSTPKRSLSAEGGKDKREKSKEKKEEREVVKTLRMSEAIAAKRKFKKKGQDTAKKETEEKSEEAVEERVVQIDRVTRVVKGGRRLRFRATVVVGDKNGRVGVAVSKGTEVMIAIQKATQKAKKELTHINLKGTTIPHEVTMDFSGAKVFLKPASEGTGIIAGGAVRAVVELCGIKDILSKSLGSNNKLNNVYATFLALKSLRKFEEAKVRPAKGEAGENK